MAHMKLRIQGETLKMAILHWAKEHLRLAGDIKVSETMVLDGVSRPIGDDNTYATVEFKSEKKA